LHKKRVLWILNHDTLGKFELPLISELGLEVYTPKIVQKDILERSGSVTFEYDSTLSIPKEELHFLNNYNFYENAEMPFHIRYIINKYFSAAIVMFDFYALRKLIDNFDGNIFARAFGLGKDITYTEISRGILNEYKLEQIRKRFWFSHCYENIPEIETGIYKDKAVFMPLGLPSEFYSSQDQWIGNEKKLLFFCTRINYNKESNEVYRKFKKDFKGFDYVIAGNQPVPVDDDKVLGFLERDELNRLFIESKVMYYDSTFPRHLHYHPLEAMIIGMPVIYLDGGALSVLGGERQSGRCKDIHEARNKVNRILNGDEKLILDIKLDQKEIIYKFSHQYNKQAWIQNFLPIFNQPVIETDQKIPRKISIFLDEKQSNYYKEDSLSFLSLLHRSFTKMPQKYNICMNLPSDQFNIEIDFQRILKMDVAVAEYKFESITEKEVKNSLFLMFKNDATINDKYLIPTNYTQNYIDSKYWIFMFSNMKQQIAPLTPYGIYVESLTERFYSTLPKTYIQNLKNAYFIFTFLESTRVDLVKHLGIKMEKVFVLPCVYSSEPEYPAIQLRNVYNLIEVDFNKFNNLSELLIQIEEYYSIYSPNDELKIHFNNYPKDGSSKNSIKKAKDIEKLIANSGVLKKHVTCFSNMRSNEYNMLYAHAKKIIFTHYIEHISNKIAKAARLFKPVYLDEMPQYKELETKLNYKFKYRNFYSSKVALIEALLDESDVDFPEMKESDDSFDEVLRTWRILL